MTHYYARDDNPRSRNTHFFEAWSKSDRRLDKFREQIVQHTPEKLTKTGQRRQLWAKIELQLATLKLQKLIENRRRFAFRQIELSLNFELKNWMKQALALTHCQFCGRAGLSLLTTSTRSLLSPSFSHKVRKLLPPEPLRELSIGDVSTMPDNKPFPSQASPSNESAEENFRPLLQPSWLEEGEPTPKRNGMNFDSRLTKALDIRQHRRGYSLPRLGSINDSQDLLRSSTHWHHKEERGRKVIPRIVLKKPAGRIFCSRLEKIFNRRKAWSFAKLSF
jgi:hypothetical protein